MIFLTTQRQTCVMNKKGLKKNFQESKKHAGFTLRCDERERRSLGENLKGGETIGDSKEESPG